MLYSSSAEVRARLWCIMVRIYARKGRHTVDKMAPKTQRAVSTGSLGTSDAVAAVTHQAELDILRAVSTVPPRTTSFMPSTTEELAEPFTRGETSDLSASMSAQVVCMW